MKRLQPSPAHEGFLLDMKLLTGKHAALPAQEMLAIASQFVGALIAAQNPCKMTPAMAMELVVANINEGNQAMVVGMLKPVGTA